MKQFSIITTFVLIFTLIYPIEVIAQGVNQDRGGHGGQQGGQGNQQGSQMGRQGGQSSSDRMASALQKKEDLLNRIAEIKNKLEALNRTAKVEAALNTVKANKSLVENVTLSNPQQMQAIFLDVKNSLEGIQGSLGTESAEKKEDALQKKQNLLETIKEIKSKLNAKEPKNEKIRNELKTLEQLQIAVEKTSMSNPSAMKQTLENAKASLEKMKASANNQGNQQGGQGNQQGGQGSKDPEKTKQDLLTRIAEIKKNLESKEPKNEKIQNELNTLKQLQIKVENTPTNIKRAITVYEIVQLYKSAIYNVLLSIHIMYIDIKQII